MKFILGLSKNDEYCRMYQPKYFEGKKNKDIFLDRTVDDHFVIENKERDEDISKHAKTLKNYLTYSVRSYAIIDLVTFLSEMNF